MIIEVGNIIKQQLEQFLIGGAGDNQFIDVLVGVVKPITKTDLDKDNKPIRKTFPVSCDLSADECITAGRYRDLIPNSNYSCMVYLEGISNPRTGNTGSKINWRPQYRLVCWYNQNKLGSNQCDLSGKIAGTIIAAFPENPFNSGVYQSIRIEVTAQDPPEYNPMAKYSYDEEKTQYLMHPYGYFSLLLQVDYQIEKRCIPLFNKQAEIPC